MSTAAILSRRPMTNAPSPTSRTRIAVFNSMPTAPSRSAAPRTTPSVVWIPLPYLCFSHVDVVTPRIDAGALPRNIQPLSFACVVPSL